MAGRAQAQSRPRNSVGMYIVAVELLVGLPFAFALGWLLGSRGANAGRPAIGMPERFNEVQAASMSASQTDQIGQLEKQVKELQTQNATLRRDKAELDNKLSVAADIA